MLEFAEVPAVVCRTVLAQMLEFATLSYGSATRLHPHHDLPYALPRLHESVRLPNLLEGEGRPHDRPDSVRCNERHQVFQTRASRGGSASRYPMCVASNPCDAGARDRMSALGRSRQVRSQESGFHFCSAEACEPGDHDPAERSEDRPNRAEDIAANQFQHTRSRRARQPRAVAPGSRRGGSSRPTRHRACGSSRASRRSPPAPRWHTRIGWRSALLRCRRPRQRR